MRLEDSKINPLGKFLSYLSTYPKGVELNKATIPAIALFFNSGGVICETAKELSYVLSVLAESGLIEIIDNTTVRITEYGKNAL